LHLGVGGADLHSHLGAEAGRRRPVGGGGHVGGEWHPVDGAEQVPVQSFQGALVRSGEGLGRELTQPGEVAGHRLQQHAVLAVERGIEAAAAQAGGGADVVDARAVVAGGAELPLGGVQDVVGVEASWSGHASKVKPTHPS